MQKVHFFSDFNQLCEINPIRLDSLLFVFLSKVFEAMPLLKLHMGNVHPKELKNLLLKENLELATLFRNKRFALKLMP